MEQHFWLEKWRKGEIGFNQPEPHGLLKDFWAYVANDSVAPVLVPLCGKSVDMLWLREQGHGICGVELSEQALMDFVTEAGLSSSPSLSPQAATGASPVFQSPHWQLIAGDWFAYQAKEPFSLFYDRAALIALPQSMRERYVSHLLQQLMSSAQGLLITLEYDQEEMSGPPFSVEADEVQALFAGRATVNELCRNDILEQEPHFKNKGLTRLQEVVWKISLANQFGILV